MGGRSRQTQRIIIIYFSCTGEHPEISSEACASGRKGLLGAGEGATVNQPTQRRKQRNILLNTFVNTKRRSRGAVVTTVYQEEEDEM